MPNVLTDKNPKDRVSRLLFALSTRFVIIRNDDSSHLNLPTDADAWSRWRTIPAGDMRRKFSRSSSTQGEPARYASMMPRKYVGLLKKATR
jgi:hypothetical protein